MEVEPFCGGAFRHITLTAHLFSSCCCFLLLILLAMFVIAQSADPKLVGRWLKLGVWCLVYGLQASTFFSFILWTEVAMNRTERHNLSFSFLFCVQQQTIDIGMAQHRPAQTAGCLGMSLDNWLCFTTISIKSVGKSKTTGFVDSFLVGLWILFHVAVNCEPFDGASSVAVMYFSVFRVLAICWFNALIGDKVC